VFQAPIASLFRLAPGAVSCGPDGLFVGETPLLERAESDGRNQSWRVRPIADLSRELSAAYGLPVDLGSKAAGLASAARALDRGDLALAQIASVLLRLPDPPPLGKSNPSIGSIDALAAELIWSGLLKGDWDPDKHPRTGEPPNPGRFAIVDKPPKAPRWGWPVRKVNIALRELAVEIAEHPGYAIPGIDVLTAFLEGFTPTELNSGEDRITQQWKANLDAPKTLEELQTTPTDNLLGYEQHHIVEANPDNVAKEDEEPPRMVDKFGSDEIDDPSNLVWIPRLKYEQVTGDYNSKDPKDPLGRLNRQVINEKSFEDQRAAGLAALRKFGVLK
jgi:hypothetical protein